MRLVLISTWRSPATGARRPSQWLRRGPARERLVVAGARIADLRGQPADRLQVVRKHIHAGLDHRGDGREVAGEVGRQRLDGRAGIASLDRADAGGVVPRPAVRQVVPVDGREDHVLEAHQLHGTGGVVRLLRVEPAPGIARVDGTEAARPRAHVAHEHDRGRAGVPALADVRDTWTPRRPWRAGARAPCAARRRSGRRTPGGPAASPACARCRPGRRPERCLMPLRMAVKPAAVVYFAPLSMGMPLNEVMASFSHGLGVSWHVAVDDAPGANG